jgi:hypothetical protein
LVTVLAVLAAALREAGLGVLEMSFRVAMISLPPPE